MVVMVPTPVFEGITDKEIVNALHDVGFNNADASDSPELHLICFMPEVPAQLIDHEFREATLTQAAKLTQLCKAAYDMDPGRDVEQTGKCVEWWMANAPGLSMCLVLSAQRAPIVTRTIRN